MDLGLGKRVISRDGQHVGQVDGLVLDYNTRDIESFIVRSGALFVHDRFVPLQFIDQIDPEGTVLLTISADEIEKLPEFAERDFVVAKPDDLRAMPAAWSSMGTGAPPVYFGTGSYAAGYRGAQSMFGAAPVDAPELETQSNLPAQDIVIDRGTDVIASDGKKLGSVDELVYGPDGRITGYIVRAGFLFHHDITVPPEMIETIGEDQVRLRVTAEQLSEQSNPT